MPAKRGNNVVKEKHIQYMQGTKPDSETPHVLQKKSITGGAGNQQIPNVISTTASTGSKDRGGKNGKDKVKAAAEKNERKASIMSNRLISPKEHSTQLVKSDEPGNECKITLPKQFLLRFYEKISKYPVYWEVTDTEVEKMLQDFYKPSPCYERRLRNRAMREKEAIEREKFNRVEVNHCPVSRRVNV